VLAAFLFEDLRAEIRAARGAGLDEDAGHGGQCPGRVVEVIRSATKPGVSPDPLGPSLTHNPLVRFDPCRAHRRRISAGTRQSSDAVRLLGDSSSGTCLKPNGPEVVLCDLWLVGVCVPATE
jgi:hypothetical protein